MIKERVNYIDFDGVERTEDFWFNLSETEIVQMQTSVKGGFTAMLKKIIEAEDETKLMPLVEEIILKSYGEKSSDGRRFKKSKELSEEFKQTEAYNQLFMKFLKDADAFTTFVNGLNSKVTKTRTAIQVPKELEEQ
jgi:5'-deoxynucleotidase YfbR-like HD superfamily hydrolase